MDKKSGRSCMIILCLALCVGPFALVGTICIALTLSDNKQNINDINRKNCSLSDETCSKPDNDHICKRAEFWFAVLGVPIYFALFFFYVCFVR